MRQPCGCCAGIEIVTPVSEVNPPGLSALSYRVGTYATFFETMLARLSNLYIDVAPADGGSNGTRFYPLRPLTTRDPSDPSIALLDAWAIVADVLTFYQERIANEGYLATATERRSILELARVVGYRLRPGVAASVYLAFTVSSGFKGTIPHGTRAQSIPGTGQMPQFFETSDMLTAADTWNNLKPRITRPQVFTPADPKLTPVASDADVIDTVYLDGISTNLRTGDGLLFIFGADPQKQFMRKVENVDAQADEKRTEVTLVQAFRENLENREIVSLFISESEYLFPDSELAQQVATILTILLDNAKKAVGNDANLIRGAISSIQERQDIVVARDFRRLSAWIGHILRYLQTLLESAGGGQVFAGGMLAVTTSPPGGGGNLTALPSQLKTSPLANLEAIVGQLSLAPAVQPANELRLARSVKQSFAPQSDNAPRLLAALHPAAATTLYQAWSNVETPHGRVEVHAARVEATFFASSYAGPATITQSPLTSPPDQSRGAVTSNTSFTAPVIGQVWSSLIDGRKPLKTVPLDATYDQIKPGTWAAIDRPLFDDAGTAKGRTTTYHAVTGAETRSMDTGTGYTAKVTLITVEPPWLTDADDTQLAAVLSSTTPSPVSTAVLRGTIIYAQSERLNLAEEPLDTDVKGDTIALDNVYEGLEPGRWIIVSGNRTDIPNVSGVTASELVMISGVAQGSEALGCEKFPSDQIPFSEVYYTTSANVHGDRLVVGKLSKDILPELRHLPIPKFPNQQYCDQVQVVPGVYADAYVPTHNERSGLFPDFEGLLIDPTSKIPFPNGDIRDAIKGKSLFAWRISSQKLHTILTLAKRLAFKYDRSSLTIYGNVAHATHGQTVGEVLGDGDGSHAFQTFPLRQSPLTYISAPTPEGAASTLATRVNEIEWHEANDLAAAGPRDRRFITSTDDSDHTTVVFGNGAHGTRVPTGLANVKAVYRYGIGAAGNVNAGQISQLATHPLGLQGVINPLPASGGADRDGADQARRNTPIAVMALDRLVSVKDYADFARAYAGIGKASAVRLSDGRRQIVHLTIAGAGDIPIDQNSDLYRNLVTSLETFGDPFLPIAVCVRKVKLLVISAGVQVLPDYQWESVAPNVRGALLALFAFDARDIGQTAFRSEAVRAMQEVAGVSYVDVQIFDSVAEDITAAQLASLGATLNLNPHVQAQLAPNLRQIPASESQRQSWCF